jgi:SAM-dependent methyltransferase
VKRFLAPLRLALDRLAGRTVFESPGYREAELSRLLTLFAFVDLERWRGARILEVGAGIGHIGDVFAALAPEYGFRVTSSDGRPEHVERMRARGREAVVLDLDTDDLSAAGEFDLVLAFGVLYHLAKPERFLRGCARIADTLVIESCVADLPGAELVMIGESRGPLSGDQALAGTGCRPSPAWVEATCRSAGYGSVRDLSHAIGNWRTGRFDWLPRGDGAWRRDGVNLRKLWLAERGPEG